MLTSRRHGTWGVPDLGDGALEGRGRPRSAKESGAGGDHPIDDSALEDGSRRQEAKVVLADDAVDGHRCFHGIAVLVEVDIPEDAVLDGRLEKLSRHRFTRAVS